MLVSAKLQLRRFALSHRCFPAGGGGSYASFGG